MKLTSGQLAKELAETTGLQKKQIEKVLSAFTDMLAVKLQAGDSVTLKGIGTLTTRDTAAFDRVCALDGKKHTLPARRRLCFRQSDSMKTFFRLEALEGKE